MSFITSFQTVIFDCCHSGSGTRNGDETVRSAGLEGYSIHPTVDAAIWQSGTEARGITSATGQAASGLESHIFLSACRADELAREDSSTGHGRFTTALLKVFNMTSPDQLTYGQALERLEFIPGYVIVCTICSHLPNVDPSAKIHS